MILSASCALTVTACDTTSPGPNGAVKVAFVVQPSDAVPGALITPLVKVAFLDANGNVVPTAQGPIAIGLGANPTEYSSGLQSCERQTS